MKTAKLTLKALSKFMGLLTVTLFVFSCSKNGQDQNVNNVFAKCANCGALTNGQTFFQSQSSDTMYGIVLNLNFIGNVGYNPYSSQYGQTQQYNNGSYNPIISYSGVVAAQGSLQLNQSIGNNYGGYNPQYGQQHVGCFMPAGTYTVGTMQAGQWNQAIVSNLILTAVGPAQVIISIPQAQVAAKTQTGATWNEVAPVGRLFGNFLIQSVNGIPCNMTTMIQ
ncbi:MAG: hypothetical protein H7235_04670 [Bdellovibrionaceae bacterium]|nr:hypothetical protein [Pseudobdellovibrionaceae bacterium]